MGFIWHFRKSTTLKREGGEITMNDKPVIQLDVEELEERIAPTTVGALHNNPDNPNNNNDHNAVPKGAIPEGPAGS
jgi:hypothetical protein